MNERDANFLAMMIVNNVMGKRLLSEYDLIRETQGIILSYVNGDPSKRGPKL